MRESGPIVRRLSAGDAARVIDVFCDAFDGYAVVRHVLGARASDPVALRHLIGLFVMGRALRDDPLFGIEHDGVLQAALTMSDPSRPDDPPPRLAVLREEVWADLGEDARGRYDACGAVWSALGVGEPHVHVNMVGVRRAWQRRGLARALLDRAARLSRETPGSCGVSLSTEEAVNVPFYRHLGYAVAGQGRIADALDTWILFQRTAPDGGGLHAALET